MELFKSRPRVAYTNKVGDKVYPVVVDIKKGIKSTEDIQFVSSDVNTGILSVAFIQGNDNYNVTGADVVCSVMRPDASTLELPCEVVGENIVEVPLGINGTSQDGVYSFDFKVFKGENKVVGTPIMNYSVSLSISNDMVVEEDDRLPVLTMLMTQVTELKDEAREVINQANTATEATKVATANAIEATNNANVAINTANQKMLEVDNAKNEMTTTVTNKVNEVETRFNALTASQQQSSEVIDARDGEVSLKARLDRDLYKDGISLSDRIEAIEGLKDSQNMKYETDKGYLVCKETKNGVIDDLKIEGKTLVNLWDINKMRKASSISVNDNYVTVNADGSWIDCHPVYTAGKVPMIKPDTEYTIITHIKTNTLNGAFCVNIDSANRSPYTSYYPLDIGFTGYHIHKLRTKTDLSMADTSLRCQIGSQCTEGTVIFNCIVLEGDYTQNPPSYFEGLMSVGQDVDKIEVLSVKGDGNLISSECKVGTLFEVYAPKGEYVASCKSKQCTIRFYRKDKTLIDYWSLNGEETIYRSFVTLEDIYYVLFDGDINTTDIQLIKGNTPKPYTPHQSDKKQILFYNSNGELEPVTELHEWDSIEKHSDNKWYYHKRSGKVVLNGSESDDAEMYSINDTLIQFNIRFNKHKLDIKTCVSDKFSFSNFDDTTSEGIQMNSSGGGMIVIRILKSKLSTQDVQGFKQWLQDNNVTVLYLLAQEEVYELAPLHLDSYANETLILCNSGAISPKMEFSITSHINELVKAYGDRISLLEEKMYKALKQVLAGDMYSLAELLYPEDFVEENPENEIMLLPFE